MAFIRSSVSEDSNAPLLRVYFLFLSSSHLRPSVRTISCSESELFPAGVDLDFLPFLDFEGFSRAMALSSDSESLSLSLITMFLLKFPSLDGLIFSEVSFFSDFSFLSFLDFFEDFFDLTSVRSSMSISESFLDLKLLDCELFLGDLRFRGGLLFRFGFFHFFGFFVFFALFGLL